MPQEQRLSEREVKYDGLGFLSSRTNDYLVFFGFPSRLLLVDWLKIESNNHWDPIYRTIYSFDISFGSFFQFFFSVFHLVSHNLPNPEQNWPRNRPSLDELFTTLVQSHPQNGCISVRVALWVPRQRHGLWMLLILPFVVNHFWPLSSPPSPLCSLSFIHCHRSFSSRSQTCLPYVIFSFSIRTLFCLTADGDDEMRETHKHTSGLTLIMTMLTQYKTLEV